MPHLPPRLPRNDFPAELLTSPRKRSLYGSRALRRRPYAPAVTPTREEYRARFGR